MNDVTTNEPQGVNAREWAEKAASLHKDFLGAVHTAIVQYGKGNTTNLAILLAVTHGMPNRLVPVADKARMEFAAPLKRILKHIAPGLEYKKDKAKAAGVKVTFDADTPINADLLDKLQAFSFDQLSYKSDKVKEAFPVAEKEVKPKDINQTREFVEKAVPRQVKQAIENGHDPLVFLRERQAEDARQIAILVAQRGEPAH